MSVAEAKGDKSLDLFAGRSVLFPPPPNPRAIAKAREAGSDLVVLDLEDAVRREDKDAARDAAAEAVGTAWPMPVAIRVNGAGTEWHTLDLDAVARSKADLVVVPRAISGHLIQGIRDVVAKPVLAMIETASGVFAASDVAKEAAASIPGTNDLRADLRLALVSTREPISASLQLIVLAARAAGAAVFDGVFNNLEDSDGFLREAEEGRRLGFDGKSLIHPSQIEPCHGIFAPSVAEVERAQALVEAFNGGAERFGDEMIERMHVEAAQRVLGRRRS